MLNRASQQTSAEYLAAVAGVGAVVASEPYASMRSVVYSTPLLSGRRELALLHNYMHDRITSQTKMTSAWSQDSPQGWACFSTECRPTLEPNLVPFCAELVGVLGLYQSLYCTAYIHLDFHFGYR